MKRNITIKANGGDVCLTIGVKIDAQNLTRWEMQRCVEDIASKIMADIPSMRNVDTPLSRIQVRGV